MAGQSHKEGQDTEIVESAGVYSRPTGALVSVQLDRKIGRYSKQR
ncbi:hypothetical protein AB4Z39_04970 [Mycobacterium adipatum]